jgi:hypothetical protein
MGDWMSVAAHTFAISHVSYFFVVDKGTIVRKTLENASLGGHFLSKATYLCYYCLCQTMARIREYEKYFFSSRTI